VARALRIPALSPGWKGSLQAIVDRGDAGPGSGNVGLNEAAASPAPAWSGFRSLRITRRVVETPTVVSLWLGGGNDGPLAEAAPGQFVALRLRPDPNAPAIIRSYSLSGPPAAGEYRISVKREPGGAAGSQLHDHVQVGDAVEVSAPRGTFSLRDRDTPIVFASAGIGVTPVLAMLHTLADRHTPQEVWWLHGARNRREHAFADEAHRLLAELPNAHAHSCYSAPGSPDELSDPDTTQGRLSADLVALLKVPVASDVYMCGPTPFMAELGTGLVGLGFDPSRIHREIFAPLAAVTPGIAAAASPPPHPPAGPQGEGPAVSFARSGLTVNWNPRYVDLLELAEACDVSTRWSCRAGVCHTCETAMLSGSVVYAPEPVDAPAAGNVLLCCAQPTTEAVLDL
jgi:ferredoxin-NADP reductase